jgi:hypothetical protein
MIDIADQIGTYSILLVVVGISAAVIAKFLVHSSLNGSFAVKTKSFFLFHGKKVFLNLEN